MLKFPKKLSLNFFETFMSRKFSITVTTAASSEWQWQGRLYVVLCMTMWLVIKNSPICICTAVIWTDTWTDMLFCSWFSKFVFTGSCTVCHWRLADFWCILQKCIKLRENVSKWVHFSGTCLFVNIIFIAVMCHCFLFVYLFFKNIAALLFCCTYA